MADFIQKTNVKSAIRELAYPIDNVTTFESIIEGIVTNNPFGCVSYTEAGVTHQPVEKTKEAYVAKVVYQDTRAKTVGTDTCRFNTLAGFNAGATALQNNAALATAHGGTASRDLDNETWSVSLRCRDPNGEIYVVTVSRDRVSLTSYSDDGIRTKIETWADSVATLA